MRAIGFAVVLMVVGCSSGETSRPVRTAPAPVVAKKEPLPETGPGSVKFNRNDPRLSDVGTTFWFPPKEEGSAQAKAEPAPQKVEKKEHKPGELSKRLTDAIFGEGTLKDE